MELRNRPTFAFALVLSSNSLSFIAFQDIFLLSSTLFHSFIFVLSSAWHSFLLLFLFFLFLFPFSISIYEVMTGREGVHLKCRTRIKISYF